MRRASFRNRPGRNRFLTRFVLTIPQFLATPVAGRLLDTFQGVGRTTGRPNLGYMVIFALAFRPRAIRAT